MARAPAAAGAFDVRSMGVLMESRCSAQSCSAGRLQSPNARRVAYEDSTILQGGRQYDCGYAVNSHNEYPNRNRGNPGKTFGSPYSFNYSGYPNQYYASDTYAPPSGIDCAPRWSPSPGPELQDEGLKYDQKRDWNVCIGSAIVVGCVFGMIHSYAVFAPDIQRYYEIGLLETILVACLCYSVLILFLPASAAIASCLGNRWAAVLGMVLFFIGVGLDALTIQVATLYVSQVLLMGVGGSIAYGAAMPIVSDHFRRQLDLAMGLVSASVCIGTVLFHLVGHLMMNYVSYRWTKFCLALFLLVCIAACQNFPSVRQQARGHRHHTNEQIKRCIETHLAPEIDDCNPDSRTYLCVCLCDVSCWSDYSFMLWAVISAIALLTVYVPYLFLRIYSLHVGADYSIGTLCWYCLASMIMRVVMMMSSNNLFSYYRNLFILACITSGVFYIALAWVETAGWTLAWCIVVGATEGIICFVVPALTIKTCPLRSIGGYWSWVVIFHGFAVILGPMIPMSVYMHTARYGPGFIALGVIQVIGGFLAFLLPNEDAGEGLGSGNVNVNLRTASDNSQARGYITSYTSPSNDVSYKPQTHPSRGCAGGLGLGQNGTETRQTFRHPCQQSDGWLDRRAYIDELPRSKSYSAGQAETQKVGTTESDKKRKKKRSWSCRKKDKKKRKDSEKPETKNVKDKRQSSDMTSRAVNTIEASHASGETGGASQEDKNLETSSKESKKKTKKSKERKSKHKLKK